MKDRALLVRQCVAESIPRPVEDVEIDAYLMETLGADSLTFLDIVFRLETEFDIQITRGEIENAARGDLSEDEFAPGGVISAAGLERLRELMPESIDRIVPGLKPMGIYGLFTPRTFLNIVETKLASTD